MPGWMMLLGLTQSSGGADSVNRKNYTGHLSSSFMENKTNKIFHIMRDHTLKLKNAEQLDIGH